MEINFKRTGKNNNFFFAKATDIQHKIIYEVRSYAWFGVYIHKLHFGLSQLVGLKKLLIFNRININSTQEWKEVEKPLTFQHKFEEFQL